MRFRGMPRLRLPAAAAGVAVLALAAAACGGSGTQSGSRGNGEKGGTISPRHAYRRFQRTAETDGGKAGPPRPASLLLITRDVNVAVHLARFFLRGLQ